MQNYMLQKRKLKMAQLLNSHYTESKVGTIHLLSAFMILRFKLKRSFHVQFSMRTLFIIKMNILLHNLYQILGCIIQIMIHRLFFQGVEKGFTNRIIIRLARSGKGLLDLFTFQVFTKYIRGVLHPLVAMEHQVFLLSPLLKSVIKGFHRKRCINYIRDAIRNCHP